MTSSWMAHCSGSDSLPNLGNEQLPSAADGGPLLTSALHISDPLAGLVPSEAEPRRRGPTCVCCIGMHQQTDLQGGRSTGRGTPWGHVLESGALPDQILQAPVGWAWGGAGSPLERVPRGEYLGGLCAGDQPGSTVTSPWRDRPAEHVKADVGSRGHKKPQSSTPRRRQPRAAVPRPVCLSVPLRCSLGKAPPGSRDFLLPIAKLGSYHRITARKGHANGMLP